MGREQGTARVGRVDRDVAVESALQLREAGVVSEVVVVSIGGPACQETLRTAMAMGADRGILVQVDGELQPLAVAKLLKAVCVRETPQLALLGKQAIDDDANQVGQMLAALADWPQATFASKIKIEGGEAIVEREVDGGLETVTLSLPAVVTTDLRLNTPRYVTLPNIMKAKKKPMDILTAAELEVDIISRLTVVRTSELAPRKAGVMVPDVAALVDKLKTEAKVI